MNPLIATEQGAQVKHVVALIPVRGGSKGVLKKNLRIVGGKPLLAWTIEDARESRSVNTVYVTTEDAELKKIALAYGALVIDRPLELAQDTSTSEDALIHALNEISANEGEVDLVVFLQATSPMRSGLDIDRAIDTLEEANADSLLSVCQSHAFLWTEEAGHAVAVNYNPTTRPRRQDMKPQFRENGSIYVFRPWVLRQLRNRLGGKIALFKMSEEAGIDIDSEADLDFVNYLLDAKGVGKSA